MLIAASVGLAVLAFAAGFFCRAVCHPAMSSGKKPPRTKVPALARGEGELRGLLEAIENYDGTQSRG